MKTVVAMLAIAMLLLIPSATALCAQAEYGSAIGASDPETSTGFVAASDADSADFTVVRYDPDDDRSGDEVYYLRFTDTSGTDDIQIGDLNLKTGKIVAGGDDDLKHPSSRIDDSWAATLDIIGYKEGGSWFWYGDMDLSGDLSRHDLRLSIVSIDSKTYAAGTLVLLSHFDYDLFNLETPDDSVGGISNGDIAWSDEDENDDVNDGDCIVFQPNGFSTSVVIDDVRWVAGSVPEEDPNTPPTATLLASTLSGEFPITVTFTINATDDEGDDLTWAFDADGDGTNETTGSGETLPMDIQFEYTSAGQFTAKFYVEDAENLTVVQASIETIAPVVDDSGDDSQTDDGSQDDGQGDGDEDDTPQGNKTPGLGLPLLMGALAFLTLRRKR